ncbi:DNA mismatch repair protein [Acrasis kona]|uniref:DNA mismatch repair protein n=1 Tax=Acrasis kona TaxID=1008807 RepID=A0AAW2YKI0_9EUKA
MRAQHEVTMFRYGFYDELKSILKSSMNAFFKQFCPVVCCVDDLQHLEVEVKDEPLIRRSDKKFKVDKSIKRSTIDQLLNRTRKEHVTYGSLKPRSLHGFNKVNDYEITKMIKSKSNADLARTITKDMLKKANFVTQMDCKFLLCTVKNEEGLLLCAIDQHAAHERIRVECLQKSAINKSNDVVQCKVLQDLETVSTTQVDLWMKHKDVLSKWYWNFQVRSNGKCSEYENVYLKKNSTCEIVFKTCPSVCGEDLTPSAAQQFLLDLEDGKTMPSSVRYILDSKACRGAIMFGDALEDEKCVEIIKNLGDCDFPFQCAHGRPTLSLLLLIAESSSKHNKCYN